MTITQSVLKHLKNINSPIRTYVLSLILSSSRKNCAAMANATGISQKMLYAFLANAQQHSEEIENQLFELAKKTRKKGVTRVLVIDPTTIIKLYAQAMEKLCHDRAGSTRHIERCLVPVYCLLVDKNITIPLKLYFWVQQKIIGTRRYESKVEITKKLIKSAMDKGIDFDYVALDGAFAVPDMFIFFGENKNSKFIMRIARNRRIQTADGKVAQLKNHPALRLKRNERAKTAQATLYGNTYFFTAQKRKTRDGGWETVFLVSNMNLSAKEQIAAYDLRWPMEKMIRTTKQKFGASQCQALQASKQQAHIMAGFFAYAILNSNKSYKEKHSVDELVNIIRKYHFSDLINANKKLNQSKHQSNTHPIVNPVQNRVQNLSYTRDSVGAVMH